MLLYLTKLSVYSFSRSALWVGTTSFMILVLPVVFETERLQLEQQQLQQQRQVGVHTYMQSKVHCVTDNHRFMKGGHPND